ncbi:MAG: hypothetical protein V4675_07480 [Verrucomicrobiota bacterium]
MFPLLTLDRWTWGFNDPTVMGWTLTTAYFLAAVAAGWASRRTMTGAPGPGQGMERTVWGLLALALVLLGLNKQLDLQNLLRDRARELYLEQGWYASRHLLIGLALTGVLGTLAAGALVLRRGLPGLIRPLRRALLLLLGLAGVILLRFLPIPALSGVLGHTLLETQPEVWHFHVVEVLELALVGWIAWEARCSGTTTDGTDKRCRR